MKGKIGLLAILLGVLALLLPAIALAQQPPAPPLLFQGTVSIDGKDGRVGTIISAEIGGVEVAANRPVGITETGRYVIQIEPDDNVGKMVVFKVNGVVGGQHEYVDPMQTAVVELDLSTGGMETYALTISSTGGGSVTTPGEGTFSYAKAKAVQLVAQADDGYRFDAWTGDVGTVADVNDSATTITMDGNKSITATFAEVAGPGGLSRNWIIAIIAIVVVVIVVVFVIRARRRGR